MDKTLADAVKGGLRPPQLIVGEREDGQAEDLTGASMTGRLRSRESGAVRAISGALTVTDGPAGQFLWTYDAADVAEDGEFDAQFNAAFGAGPTPARTYLTRWRVRASLD